MAQMRNSVGHYFNRNYYYYYYCHNYYMKIHKARDNLIKYITNVQMQMLHYRDVGIDTRPLCLRTILQKYTKEFSVNKIRLIESADTNLTKSGCPDVVCNLLKVFKYRR